MANNMNKEFLDSMNVDVAKAKEISKIKNLEKKYNVKLKAFPEELIRYLPIATQNSFFGGTLDRPSLGQLEQETEFQSVKYPQYFEKPKLKRINGKIYLPELETNQLIAIANNRSNEINLIRNNTRNMPEARGLHGGFDDQSKLINDKIIDAGRIGNPDRMNIVDAGLLNKASQSEYGQRMSVLPERGKGSIYRIGGISQDSPAIPLTEKYQIRDSRNKNIGQTHAKKYEMLKEYRPELLENLPKIQSDTIEEDFQYIPYQYFEQRPLNSDVNTRAFQSPLTDEIVYDHKMALEKSEFPNVFPSRKDEIEHHELYHRGPGRAGYMAKFDHEDIDKLFKELNDLMAPKDYFDKIKESSKFK
jgi:hypothetical protein